MIHTGYQGSPLHVTQVGLPQLLTEEELSWLQACSWKVLTSWPAPESRGMYLLVLLTLVFSTWSSSCYLPPPFKSLEVLPANESLIRSWHWPSNQTGFALSASSGLQRLHICRTDHHHHRLDTANGPAVCCSSLSSPRSIPSAGSAAHRDALPPTTAAKAPWNNRIGAVGSNSESRYLPDMSFRQPSTTSGLKALN